MRAKLLDFAPPHTYTLTKPTQTHVKILTNTFKNSQIHSNFLFHLLLSVHSRVPTYPQINQFFSLISDHMLVFLCLKCAIHAHTYAFMCTHVHGFWYIKLFLNFYFILFFFCYLKKFFFFLVPENSFFF